MPVPNMDRLTERLIPTWLLAGLMATTYAGISTLVYLAVQAYPDQSPRALAHWAFLYLVGIVQPAFFGVRIHRRLKDTGPPRRQRNFCAFAPGIVGGVTLLFALMLIRE